MNKFTGIVQKGEGLGRPLGFPTANIHLDDESVSGIFAAIVDIGEQSYHGAAYADQARHRLEVYIFDYLGELYGREISISLIKRIRDAKKFENDEALRLAITNDVAKIRMFFGV